MQLTIIADDGFVAVDRAGYTGLELPGLDPAIHAVQFTGASGWVEYRTLLDGTKPANAPIESVEAFQACIDAWSVAHAAATAPPPPPDLREVIVSAVQQRLDTFARTRNYDGILSACTYATSTVPAFQAEGQCCIAARDATWAMLYALLAEVEAGTRPTPTGYADIEPLLPVLEWPE